MAIAFVRALPTSGTLGAAATTITVAYDATGCTAIVCFYSFGQTPLGDVSAITLTSATYAAASMTQLVTATVATSSVSALMGLIGIINPATGTNNLVITMSGTGSAGGATNALPVMILGYSGVASFGSTFTANPSGQTANSPTIGGSTTAGNVLAGGAAHGDTITGAHTGTTLRGAVNNYATSTAGSCVIAGEVAGGGTVSIAFDSSASDHWLGAAVELVAAGASTFVRPTIIVPTVAVNRGSSW